MSSSSTRELNRNHHHSTRYQPYQPQFTGSKKNKSSSRHITHKKTSVNNAHEENRQSQNANARNSAEWKGLYEIGIFILGLFQIERKHVFLEWIPELVTWVDTSCKENENQLHQYAKKWITTIEQIVVSININNNDAGKFKRQITYYHKDSQNGIISRVDYIVDVNQKNQLYLNELLYISGDSPISNQNESINHNNIKHLYQLIDSNHPLSAGIALACLNAPHCQWKFESKI